MIFASVWKDLIQISLKRRNEPSGPRGFTALVTVFTGSHGEWLLMDRRRSSGMAFVYSIKRQDESHMGVEATGYRMQIAEARISSPDLDLHA